MKTWICIALVGVAGASGFFAGTLWHFSRPLDLGLVAGIEQARITDPRGWYDAVTLVETRGAAAGDAVN